MLDRAQRRGILAIMGALSLTCHAQATPPPEPPPVATVAAEPEGLDPSLVDVDASSALGRARAALELDDAALARTIVDEALVGAPDDAAGELLWIRARAAARQSDAAAQRESLERLARSSHPLARWAGLELARTLFDTEPEAALAALAPLVAETWTAVADARGLHARLAARTDAPDAEATVRAALAAELAGSDRATLTRVLADRFAAREDDEDARAEAVHLYRVLASGAATADAAEALHARADAVAATLPEARREGVDPTAELDAALARAEAISGSQRHAEAERAFAAILTQLEDDPARRCRALLGRGRAQYRRRARTDALTTLSRVTREHCADADVVAWSHYYSARSHAGLHHLEEAIAEYDALVELAPTHRLADDALVGAALLSLDLGRTDEAIERLRRAAEEHGGDMRGEARFHQAWLARRAGHLDESLRYLELSIGEGPGETDEDVRGRARYWYARTLADLGRTDDAVAALETAIRERPLGYYAQQSLARLATLDAARADALRPAAGDPAELEFPHRSEMDEPAFARALALLRVGEHALATRELGTLELVAEDASEESLWLVAALYDRAGADSRACELVRRRLLESLLSRPPGERERAMLRIGFPRAFSPLIDDAASAEDVPPTFVRAIAREESSFDPSAVSVAHAYGLLQIIRPTAARIARTLDLPADAAALRTPEVNVRIGARYMANLRRRYATNPAVVPAAYNAGEGAVDRWLRERSDRQLDEWIEEIPYDETRRYTRRVLQSWGIYSWLDHGTLPALSPVLPTRG